ncbi:MAG: hypothetical protein WCT39_03160, partial [Candidatus Margulisiibacteriota bacterium]
RIALGFRPAERGISQNFSVHLISQLKPLSTAEFGLTRRHTLKCAIRLRGRGRSEQAYFMEPQSDSKVD